MPCGWGTKCFLGYGTTCARTITVMNGDTRSLDRSSHGASEKDSSLHRVLGGVPC